MSATVISDEGAPKKSLAQLMKSGWKQAAQNKALRIRRMDEDSRLVSHVVQVNF